MKKKLFVIIFINLFLMPFLFSVEEPENLKLVKEAYSFVVFDTAYDENLNDWAVTIKVLNGKNTKITLLYWADGKFLPESELANKDKYLPIFYYYPIGQKLQEPETYTAEQIEKYRNAGLSSTRKNDPYSPDYFLDAIYDSSTRLTLEQQIIRTTFLGHKVTVHKKILTPLARVEEKILKEAETNTNISEFLKNLDHAEGYNWREIRDINRKSLHSIAIAIDFLPEKLNRHMYWRWTKDQKGDKWMMVPIRSRWMPPYDFIDIFEEEGFIWGGKWEIWDNMHFEYRPEIILYSKQQQD